MNQMEQLWQFMQEDLKGDRLAAGMKHAAIRQNAEKARDIILEQQKLSKQLDEQVAAQIDRKDAVKDAIRRCSEQLAALNERLATEAPTNLEELRALIAEAERYRKNIQDYEQELKRMNQQSGENVNRFKTIGSAAAQAKQDFEKFKKEFQAEVDKDTASGKKEELKTARAAAKTLGEQVPQALMDEYLSIKKHIIPPMARLINGACSGCNTSQPSALLAKINGGNDIVECETCGRILIK